MTSEVKVTGHEWSEESLFCKAVLYFEQMESHAADDWQYGFWSALSLEFLARAALAHISPAFLANLQNWRNLAHALGKSPTAKKFPPNSVSTREVFVRLHELMPDFNKEILNFCIKHTERRNSEVHSGHLAFESLGTSEWLPRFYLACSVLTESMDRDFADLIPDPEEAVDMIDSLKDDVAKAVRRDIETHKEKWSKKTEKEKKAASIQATTWARRESGHRTDCPSCNCKALLRGSPSGPVSTKLDGDYIVQRQAQLPSSFECIACGLRIFGFSKLSACGLGDAFSKKSIYTPADFFDLYTEDDLEQAAKEFEADFND
ncbi:MAG: hypothetical protein F4X32_03975 [Candidatus Dadabacteria bacterium]|nr:hypothetical protein [Candidatus Dadabacteria bacterium]